MSGVLIERQEPSNNWLIQNEKHCSK
jgi:hypothetical protein